MKSSVRFTIFVLLFGVAVFPVPAAFTSLHVFGDGVCTTTNGPGGSYYYNTNGQRFSNGRVWVEVLAQRQGLASDTNKNWSYYGHYSSNMVINVNNFTRPADSNTTLYVVWACDADFVWNVQNYGANLAQWTNAINQSLTNHFKIITNLYYAKGARTLIMPNAVDLTEVPFFQNYTTSKSFVRQRVIDFNAAFATTLDQARAACPALKIYVPDIFTLLDNVVANPANYGLIKPETCVICDLPPEQWTLNGPGTNYVFWDDLDPTAKFHMVLADAVQQLIAPVQNTRITSLGTSNRLDLINIPIGRNGIVEGSTNFTSWTTLANITSTNATQQVFVPVSGPLQLYRLRFPFAWTWP